MNKLFGEQVLNKLFGEHILNKLFNEQVLNKLFNEQLLKSSDQDALNTTTKFTSSFFDELLQRSDKVYGILITVSFG